VEGTTVVSMRNVGVGFARQVEGALLGEGNAEEQDEVVALEARQVHLGKVDGGNLAAAEEVGQIHRRGKGRGLRGSTGR